MRVAVLIIGLLLGVVMFIQTVLVYGLSNAADQENTASAGAIGIVMALLWLVACAFVLPFPMASVVAFAIAGILGFAGSGDFPDLATWGVVSLALAVLSFFGWRGKKKANRETFAERQRQLERDNRLETLLTSQHTERATVSAPADGKVTFPTFCPSCNARNDASAKFCAECGASLASAIPTS